MRFGFGEIFRFSSGPCRPPGLRRCLSNRCRENVLVCKVGSSIIVTNSLRDIAGVGGIDVRCLRRFVADRSAGTIRNRRSRFCARSVIWIAAPNQVRTWIVDTLTAHTLETSQTAHLDTSFDLRSKRKAAYCVPSCFARRYA